MNRVTTMVVGVLAAGAAVGGVALASGSGDGAGAPAGASAVRQPAGELSRAPRPAERTAISSAALTALSPASRPKYRVAGIRVSTRSRYWSTASLVPRPAFRNVLPSGGVVLVRSAISGRWTPVDLGTDAIGCGIAPISVLRDFGWAGTCPPRDRL
jgi:hypothetical protein